MGNYTPEAMACTLDKIHEGVEDINKHIETKETDNMNDTANAVVSQLQTFSLNHWTPTKTTTTTPAA